MQNKTPEEIIKGIDGDLFKRQRLMILDMAKQADKEGDLERSHLLDGLVDLLDNIADTAHDTYGVDCLLGDPEEDSEEGPGPKMVDCDQFDCQVHDCDTCAHDPVTYPGCGTCREPGARCQWLGFPAKAEPPAPVKPEANARSGVRPAGCNVIPIRG